jgi:hypothetical protein
MEHRRGQEKPKADWRAVERGWFLGEPEFKQELLAQMRDQRRDHCGPGLREADLAHAERVVKAELSRRGWKEADLEQRRKNDPDKLEIAAWLRRGTALSVKDIAVRVRLGTSKGANANLHRHMRRGSKPGPRSRRLAIGFEANEANQ